MGGGEGGVGHGISGSSSNDSTLAMGMVDEKQRSEAESGGAVERVEEKGSACLVFDEMPPKGNDFKGEKKDDLYGFECRICHLESDLEQAEGSELIQLGCGCKGELGMAHRHCGEAWFKLKGNRFCEICGVIAKNITGSEDDRFLEEWNERRMQFPDEAERGCLRDHPFCKFLIVCLVIAFILPWFFRVSMF